MLLDDYDTLYLCLLDVAVGPRRCFARHSCHRSARGELPFSLRKLETRKLRGCREWVRAVRSIDHSPPATATADLQRGGLSALAMQDGKKIREGWAKIPDAITQTDNRFPHLLAFSPPFPFSSLPPLLPSASVVHPPLYPHSLPLRAVLPNLFLLSLRTTVFHSMALVSIFILTQPASTSSPPPRIRAPLLPVLLFSSSTAPARSGSRTPPCALARSAPNSARSLYAMSGTDFQYLPIVCAYTHATRCPVVT